MGRELKRVALSFKYPLNKVWQGYLNPYNSTPCAYCDQSGLSPIAKTYNDQWYGNEEFDPVAYGSPKFTKDDPAIQQYVDGQINRKDEYRHTGSRESLVNHIYNHWKDQWRMNLSMADVCALLAADRLEDITHKPRDAAQHFVLAMQRFNGASWYRLHSSNGHIPSVEEVNYFYRTSHYEPCQHVVLKARCEREGVPYECEHCGGSGRTWAPGMEQLNEAWQPTEPPEGEGYQLWETTSEGSPISPVFSSLDLLCQYAAKNCTVFGHSKASAAKWREMLDDDCVVHREGNMVFV